MKATLNKILLAVLCAIFAISAGMILAFSLNADGDNVDLKDEYIVGDALFFPKNEFEVEGKKYTYETYVVKPDGSTAKSERITFADAGVYTLMYVKEVDGKVYSEEYELKVVAPIYETSSNRSTAIYYDNYNDFIWDIMCDWFIEITKPRMQEGGETAENAQRVLVYVMSGTLKLLHPFMPFITEEIWQALPHEGESIMVSQWPQYDEALNFKKEEAEFEILMDAIKAIRNTRSQMNVPPSKKADLFIETAHKDIFENGKKFLERLASAAEVHIGDRFDMDGAVQVIANGSKTLIPMDELVDKEKERARLEKERQFAKKTLQ